MNPKSSLPALQVLTCAPIEHIVEHARARRLLISFFLSLLLPHFILNVHIISALSSHSSYSISVVYLLI